VPKYHINTKGEPSVCRAFLRACPRGGAESHFPSRMDATVAAERRHAEDYGHTAPKRAGTPNRISANTSIAGQVQYHGLRPDQLLSTGQQVASRTLEALGVSAQQRTGKLVESGCFNKYAITGTLNREALNDSSHREFGFQSVVMEDRLSARSVFTPFDPELNHTVSRAETKDLPVVEKSALNFFSTQNYQWFAPYITDPSLMEELPEGSAEEETLVSEHDTERVDRDMNIKAFDPDNFVQQNTPEKITKRNIRHVVEHLDSALSKGAKTQRIVYRGVSLGSPIFDGYTSARQYVKENLSLGSVIEFSAYQSASAHAGVGHAYAERGTGNGIIYEILTPEGINITDVSDVIIEREVLLPRNQRYTVVGTHTMMTGSYEPGRSSVSIVQLVAVNKNGEVLDGTNADPIDPFQG
jgi:hypothetical protein